MLNSDQLLKIEELNALSVATPLDGSIHFQLGKAYREINDFKMSLNELNKTQELGFNTAEVHLEIGRVYQALGDNVKFEKELKIALELNPSNGYTHLELSRIFREKKDYNSALKELKQVFELGIDNEEAHIELGRIYAEKGDSSKAIEELRKALVINPLKGHVHFELGRHYQKNKDYDSAIREILLALEFGVNREDAYLCLGALYRQKNDYVQSARQFQEALKVSPNKDDIFFSNKILNEIEISQRKIILSSKPRILGVTLSNKCNLRCSICDIWSVPWEIPEKIVQGVIGLLPYLEQVVWQGGEVFLVDYFEELFDKAILYPHLNQSIVTNGLLIDERWAKKLARKNVNLTIGVDGISKNTYEAIRKGGKFENLLNCLGLINKYKQAYNKDAFMQDKMTTIMNFVVMGLNYLELEKTLDFAKEFGFDTLQLYTIEGVVDLNNIFLHNNKEALEYIENIRPELFKKAMEYEIKLDMSLPRNKHNEDASAKDNLLKNEHFEPNCPNIKDDATVCYLPWQQIYMTPDHKLKAGCYCNYEIGDIFKDSLEEIWNGKMMQLYRKKIIENDCKFFCYRVPKELDAHFELMRISYKEKDYAQVIAGLDKLIEFINLNPDNLEAHILLGRIYFRIRNDYNLAAKEFKKAIIISIDNIDAHFELGLVYRKMQDYGSAEKEIKLAMASGFSIGQGRIELGGMHRERGEFNLALEELGIALRNDPSDSHIRFELGKTYLEVKDYNRAIKEFKKAVELGLDDENIYISLSTVYRQKKEYCLAIEESKFGLNQYPDSASLHLELGENYYQAKNYAASIDEFKKAMDLGLDDANIHIRLSNIHIRLSKAYREKEDYSNALREALIALRGNSPDSQAYFELGRVYRGLKDFDLAGNALRKAIELDTDNEEIHRELGAVYFQEGKYDIGLKEFQTCFRLNPNNGCINIELGLIYKANNDYGLAVKEFEEAINKGIDSVGIYTELEKLYRKQSGYSLTEKKLEAVVKLNPENKLCNLELAWVYEDKKEYNLAIEQLQMASQKGVNKEYAYQCLQALNRKKKILEAFNKFIEDDSDIETVTPGVIIEYIFQEGYDLYIKKLEEISKNLPENISAHIELAWIYGWHKKYGLALDEIKKINEIRPYNEEIRGRLNRLMQYNKDDTLLVQEFKNIFDCIYNFNSQEIELNEECILTLKNLFSDKAEEIDYLLKDLPGISNLHDWRYPAITKEEGALLYIITRILKPEVIVEAGTWMGTSTAYLAKGCCDNKKGKVITVDIKENVGYGIPDCLLPYIEFNKKIDIRKALPEICNKNNRIDMFIHDSVNSYELLEWEMNEILPVFSKDGIIAAHDVLNINDSPGNDVAAFFGKKKENVKCYFFDTGKGFAVMKDPGISTLKRDKK